jgi:hypothetical protein
MSDETKIGVVILTMENSEDTIECLASLARIERDDVEVILVANGSSDTCVMRIHSRFPNVAVIRRGENIGFAAGCNLGIRAAIEELGCTHVLLLNNDTVVQPDILDEMMCAMNSAPDIAAVGAKIYFYDRPNVIDHVGGVMDPVTGIGTRAGIFEEERGRHETLRDSDYATGAALFTSAEMLERIGLLDPAYFNYFEDTDWCARARAEGLRIVVNPKAKAWHKISRAVTTLWTLYIDARNRGLYVWKNYPQNFERFVDSYAADLCRMISKFERDKAYSKILALLMGLEDFCKGNFGKGRIDEVRKINPRFKPPLRTRARVRLASILAKRVPSVLQKRIKALVLKGKAKWPVRARGSDANAPKGSDPITERRRLDRVYLRSEVAKRRDRRIDPVFSPPSS